MTVLLTRSPHAMMLVTLCPSGVRDATSSFSISAQLDRMKFWEVISESIKNIYKTETMAQYCKIIRRCMFEPKKCY